VTEQSTETTPATTEKTPGKRAEVAKAKPMSATQRRDVQKLIDGEFEALKGDLGVFTNQLRIERARQIEEQFAERERQARQVEAEWQVVSAELRERADAWVRAKRDEGYTITARDRYGNGVYCSFSPITVSIPEKDRALKEADNIVSHQKMTAIQALERQRLTMQKDVILDGLVDQAKDLLAKMPNPRDLIAQILQGAREQGLAIANPPTIQQIEGEVQIRHDHGDQQAVYIGEVVDPADVP